MKGLPYKNRLGVQVLQRTVNLCGKLSLRLFQVILQAPAPLLPTERDRAHD